ncbi:MAG: dolichyl-phosphate-mannose--protein mannosyltransferase, partial [Micromonosporaceae bacterium]
MIDGTDVTERAAAATLSAELPAYQADQDRDGAAGNGRGDTATAASPRVPEAIRRRLSVEIPGRPWVGWLSTVVIAAIAGILRFVDLGFPSTKIFDEVYYASEGAELLQHGVEWRADPDPTLPGYGDYVVHPPLGKWMIAAGIKIFGDNSYGWRFAGAVVGTLAVLILARTARRMFRSTVLGCTAGLLMALDGMQLVLSRTAILDIFLMFWVLVAFACLVVDRDVRRRRWLRLMEAGLDPTVPGAAGRPRLSWSGVPWWRLGAAVAAGAACGVKWSGIFFVPVFLLLVLVWEAGTRRIAGVARPWRDTIIDESAWIGLFLVIMLGAYLASWTGWFVTDTGWKRHWLASHGKPEPFIIGALQNLWEYHREVYAFHAQLDDKHQYQSWPWQWLLLGRPVAFYYNGDPVCGATSCSAEIILLGTPALWWSFIPALLAMGWFGVSRRDWRAPAIALGAAAGILPWFYYQAKHRTMFYFYAIPSEPFL